MAMKITGGLASGISLSTPKTMNVRPTGVRAKKALFDSLGSSFSWEGKIVVDLFAGTGGLGLEAASRGAEKVYLVEKSPSHCKFAADNIEKIKRAGVESKMKILQADVFSAPPRLQEISGRIDIIFADPPYAKFALFYKKLLRDAKFAELGKNAVMIWEQPPDSCCDSHERTSLWQVYDIRKFAQTQFIFLKRTQS